MLKRSRGKLYLYLNHYKSIIYFKCKKLTKFTKKRYNQQVTDLMSLNESLQLSLDTLKIKWYKQLHSINENLQLITEKNFLIKELNVSRTPFFQSYH